MGRLVDIDEVIKVAENTFPQEDVRKIMWVLCHTPTAYDIEKVEEQLDEYITKIVGRKSALYQTIMRIVRKGGSE